MLKDNIKNLSLYKNLGERIYKALLFLNESNFSKMQNGRFDIDDDNIYVLVNRYNTKKNEVTNWESHRKFIDVQFVAEGIEQMGISTLDKMTVIQEYNDSKDIQFLKGSGNFIEFNKNDFIVLYPSDVHMPGIIVDSPKEVLKVVVKVKI